MATIHVDVVSAEESIFSGGMGIHVVWVGLAIGLMALGAGLLYFNPGDAADKRWQTIFFTSLAFMQMGQALASRSSQESLFSLGLFSNPVLLGLLVLTIALQLMVVYVPFLDRFFQVTPLKWDEMLLCAGLGLATFLLIEAEKMWRRRSRPASS